MLQREVLVVDDSPSARFALRKHLERCRLAVKTVDSGPQALAYIAGHRPLAIFLDQLMPGMNGLDVLRALKGNAGTAGIPVIIVTSVEAPEFHQQARAGGALDVLQKPPRPDRIQSLCERMATQVEVSVPVSPPRAVAPALVPITPLPPVAEPYAELRNEINVHLRRLTEDIFVQLAELKMQLAQPETAGLSADEQDTLRRIARQEADGLQNAVREEIDAIRRRLDTMDFLQRKDRDELLRAVRVEAVTAAEHTVNDVVTKLSHRISETVLKALGR